MPLHQFFRAKAPRRKDEINIGFASLLAFAKRSGEARRLCVKSILFAFFLCSSAYAQQLHMHKTFGGAHFLQDTIYISHRQLSEILSVDPQASEEFKIARKNYRIGGLLGFGGAVLLAIPVVSAVSGGEPEWLMAGGGIALLLASIPFSKSFKQHSGAAIDGYNIRHPLQSRRSDKIRPKLYFNGAGATLKF